MIEAIPSFAVLVGGLAAMGYAQYFIQKWEHKGKVPRQDRNAFDLSLDRRDQVIQHFRENGRYRGDFEQD